MHTVISPFSQFSCRITVRLFRALTKRPVLTTICQILLFCRLLYKRVHLQTKGDNNCYNNNKTDITRRPTCIYLNGVMSLTGEEKRRRKKEERNQKKKKRRRKKKGKNIKRTRQLEKRRKRKKKSRHRDRLVSQIKISCKKCQCGLTAFAGLSLVKIWNLSIPNTAQQAPSNLFSIPSTEQHLCTLR